MTADWKKDSCGWWVESNEKGVFALSSFTLPVLQMWFKYNNHLSIYQTRLRVLNPWLWKIMGLHFDPKLLKHVTLKDYKWPNMLTTIKPFLWRYLIQHNTKTNYYKLPLDQEPRLSVCHWMCSCSVWSEPSSTFSIRRSLSLWVCVTQQHTCMDKQEAAEAASVGLALDVGLW